MDELSQKVADDEAPFDIEVTRLPSCLLVSLPGVPIVILAITILALVKSPYMLLRGWQRLLYDLIGREGPFLETVCVPFAGLAILLWPLAVIGAVIAAIICSFFLGFYGAVVVYEEKSMKMGFAYIVSIISLFDEYTNDQLFLREGSCIPRPCYRNNKSTDSVKVARSKPSEQRENRNRKLDPTQSRTLKKAIQLLQPMQIWDWLFKSCELNGRILIDEGLIDIGDIEESVSKGMSKKLSIKLPAWCIFQCLLSSAKTEGNGLLISDGVELTNINWPEDKVLGWLFGPLLIMKEQIKGLNLEENEESCLKKLIMINKNERPEDWDYNGFPSDDKVRRAQIQAMFRRLQGMVASLSRMPTFRRRFSNLLKALYVYAIETCKLSSTQINPKARSKIDRIIEERKKHNRNLERASLSLPPPDLGDLV